MVVKKTTLTVNIVGVEGEPPYFVSIGRYIGGVTVGDYEELYSDAVANGSSITVEVFVETDDTYAINSDLHSWSSSSGVESSSSNQGMTQSLFVIVEENPVINITLES